MDVPVAVEVPAEPPGVLRHLVDGLQARFFPGAMDTTTARWVAFLLILLVAILLGRFGVGILFSRIRKLSARASNQLMVPALEPPTATLVILCGIVAAL